MRIVPLVLILLISASVLPVYAQGTFWLSGWDYRISFTLTANYNDVQANFTLTIPATYYDSVRVTEDDGVTLCPVWNDSVTNIWARFPYANQTYYLYYGNDAAVAVYDATAVFQRVISSGVVLALPMNEGAGATCTDYSGNGNNLTFAAGANAPVWVTGKHNSALDFESGTPDWTDLTASFPAVTDFSIAFWANPETLDSAVQSVLDSGVVTAVGFGAALVDLPYALRAYIGSSSAEVLMPTMALGSQQHFAVTFSDAGNTIEGYLDGSSKGNTAYVGSVPASAIIPEIGARTNEAFAFDGIIGELFVFSSVLSDDEVADFAAYYPQCSSANLGSLYLRRWSNTLTINFGSVETSAAMEANNNLLAIGLLAVGTSFTFVIVMVKWREK